jgi:CSLREA domain-containing protein
MRLRLLAVVAWLCVGPAFAGTAFAQGATFFVTSTSDSSDSNAGDGVCAATGGGCTLRAAIQEANALAGLDTIRFEIGSGPQTIAVGSALPSITAPVIIDGTTQPGFAGSPLIAVSGGGSTRGLKITGGGATLRGLALADFAGDGLEIRGPGGNVVETCYVGMALDGVTAAGNSGSGIVLESSSNNRIGGTSKSQRNLISGNTGKGNGGGILMNGGSGNIIQGNFIGTDITGTLDRGNQGRGIALNGATNNTIGGPEPGAGNLISGNRATGVRLLAGSDNNLVQSNFMGVDRTVTAYIANDRGVQIRGSHGNQILNNVIAGHVYDGVLIWEGASNNQVMSNVIAYNGQGPIGDPTEAAFNGVLVITGTGNKILTNAIYGNGTMGIQLGTPVPAVTPNDTGDGDTGGNNLQNYPVITSARLAGTTTTIAGTLNSAANSQYYVQFFADSYCDARFGHGEGRYVLGGTTIATNASGNASFQVAVAAQVPVGWIVTATATDTGWNTSEFSACVTVR